MEKPAKSEKTVLQKHANTFKKHGIWEILGKNADNGAKCCLDTFSGRRRRGCLKFPSLGKPPPGGNVKKHPLEGSGGETVALR